LPTHCEEDVSCLETHLYVIPAFLSWTPLLFRPSNLSWAVQFWPSLCSSQEEDLRSLTSPCTGDPPDPGPSFQIFYVTAAVRVCGACPVARTRRDCSQHHSVLFLTNIVPPPLVFSPHFNLNPSLRLFPPHRTGIYHTGFSLTAGAFNFSQNLFAYFSWRTG